MASSDSQIDKPQRGRPKRAELPDVNINTGSLFKFMRIQQLLKHINSTFSLTCSLLFWLNVFKKRTWRDSFLMLRVQRRWDKRTLHDDIIWLQLPECFEASYCIHFFCFCEESLMRDTNLHNKDCSEMHSGSCSQMTSSCKCPIPIQRWAEPNAENLAQEKFDVWIS